MVLLHDVVIVTVLLIIVYEKFEGLPDFGRVILTAFKVIGGFDFCFFFSLGDSEPLVCKVL